jgi:acyl carrier protein
MAIGKAKNWVNGVSESNDAISRIREFVLQKFPLARKRKVENSDNLLESGVIDSLGVLELVAFLQQEFGVAISDDDLTPENFKNIECMAQFVESMLEPQPGAIE